MNTITMADEPADAWAYALKMGFPDGPHLAVQWPEIARGVPVSNDVLFADVDSWIAALHARSVTVVTHSALLAHRLRRRVAEGVLLPEALRFVYLSGGEARALDINQFGVVRAWPSGWCDADAEESAAILRARMDRKGRR